VYLKIALSLGLYRGQQCSVNEAHTRYVVHQLRAWRVVKAGQQASVIVRMEHLTP